MEKNRQTIGFTILEMLVVVAVIVILVSMVITLTSRFEDRGNERVIKSTFAMLDAALGEFADYGYDYKHDDEDYANLSFPLDCNDFLRVDFEDAVEDALGLGDTDVVINREYDPNYSGSAAMYFFLSQVPDCREVLDRIDVSLVTNEDKSGNPLQIVVDGQSYPLNRIIDPWGETIRYSYYRNKEVETSPTSEPEMENPRTFPLLTSAGPDGQFDTPDDIKSNE
jgi:type II secretory pathway pseudopilin PulG